MFAMTMSPKVLNVEKLEKKFASLTKSRESIQGLSMWIIRHKEFYKDIVNQWLEALSRDLNALTMFYVANDVIQNCGRKKAPEYREAFATVLEKAVSLDKVKGIKTEVTRMLTLWHERAIYDDIFYKKLQEKLNSVEESESDKEELYEADIIANFKLENLIESLRKLKTLEDELFEKEAFLEDIEEPGMSNIDNLIVKMDSQKELRKFDKFQKLVEDYISLSDKVLTAKKVALLNLKHSSIFYSAQLEDAKKVAHAYRIYGKKVKMLEKSLSEKLPTLPEPVLVLEEKNSSRELNSSLECESSGNNLESSIGNVIVENNLTTSAVDGKCNAPYVGIQNSPSAILNATEISSDGETSLKSPVILETTKNTSLEKILTSPRIVDAVKSEKILKSPIMTDAAKNNEILLKTQTIVDALKSANIEKILRSPAIVDMAKGITAVDAIKNASSEKVLKSPVIVDIVKGVPVVDTLKSANTEKILKSPVIVDIAKGITVVDAIKSANTEKILKSPVIVDIAKGVTAVDIAKGVTAVDIEKNANSKEKIVKSSAIPDKSNNEENVMKALIPDSENLTTVSSSSEISESSLTSKVVDSSDSKQASKAESQTLSDFENIDFLLEKAYNKHHNKSKASFKRKIDNLLKSKQSKACKLSKDDDILNLYQESKTASESSDLEAAMQIEPSAVSDENNSNAKKCDISEPTVIKEESIVDVENTSNAEKVSKAPEQIENIKTDQPVEVEQSAKISDPDISKNTPSSNSFSFPSFPDIPTELLKNILDKHRINMNLSSNAESGSSSNEISNSVTENDKGLNLNQSNMVDSNVTDDSTQNSSTKVVTSNNLESKTEDTKNNSEKMLVEDNTSNESAKKAALSADSMLDTNIVQKSSNVINSTPFLENLQNILECFTKKETAFNQLKNSETLNSLPSMPLENTLKVYNCIMQCYKNIDTLNSSNNNTVPDISSTELLSNDRFCSSETKTNINSLEIVSSLKKDSSLFDNASECINSKNDNLEIMDMEVDSDDENTN